MPIIINGSGTIGGPTTFTDNLTLGTSVLATPSGSAPSYTCRAWVNFNGTGTVAIRASGNVSSITDNGTGAYTVNFTTAMPDANYSANVTSAFSGNNSLTAGTGATLTTTQCQVTSTLPGVSAADSSNMFVVIFR